MTHRDGKPSAQGERGQASVELLATVPAVLLVGALVWQLALAGWSAWLSAGAARAAARAVVVGRDGGAAARSAVPASLRRGLRFDRTAGGGVRVRLRMPLLVSEWKSPVTIGATARLGGGG
jgi:hypothetical protein